MRWKLSIQEDRMARTDHNSDGVRPGLVGSLLHGLAVLDMFSKERPVVTVAEIAQKLGLHRSSASRIAATLAAAKYLRPVGEPGQYRLAGKLVALGQLAQEQTELVSAAAQPLADLVADLGETGHLAVLDGAQSVTVSVVDGWQTVRMHSHVGKRAPAHCSSMGKMLLAGLTDAELDALYADDPPERRTPNTITTLAGLKKHLAAARDAGYTVDNEELEPGLCCVAGPIFDPVGQLVASLSISGPSSRINAETIPVIAGKVMQAARSTSDNLGAPASIDGWYTLAPTS
jgi:DNA-binding IclR family transcriptional regulator